MLNFTDAATTKVAKLTLSNIEGSDNTNSGFSAVRVDDDGAYSYVGLLSTTDVGAPFTNTSQPAAEWTAIVRNAVFTGNQPSAPFILNVAFTGGAGTIKTRLGGADYGTENNLIIDGQFGANGVIYGSVTFADNSNFVFGSFTLSGLIGVNGAVGVYAGISLDRRSFAGGFVALPKAPPACVTATNCVKYAAWESSFDTGGVNEDETLQESGFTNEVDNTGTYIKAIVMGGKHEIVINKTLSTSDILNTSYLRLNDTAGQDGYESGIAYAGNTPAFTGQTYAGILPTTNLGSPLVDGSKDGTWTGGLRGWYGDENPLFSDNLSMRVTWTGSGGTIKSLTNATSNTLGASEDLTAGADVTINVSGNFNAAGVMWGDVAFDATTNNGHFSGLIGAKGAVGVFQGTVGETVGAFGSGYAGGFVLNPPTP